MKLAAIILLILGIPLSAEDTALAAAPVPSAQPFDSRVREARLHRVIDGDTAFLTIIHATLPVEVAVTQKIRLKDVRSPEAKTAEGERAKAALHELLFNKKSITVLLTTAWSYDRQVGIVWADGVNVNDEMRRLPQGGR